MPLRVEITMAGKPTERGERMRVAVLAEFIKAQPIEPSEREVAAALGVDKGTVRHHIAVLIARGQLVKTSHNHRGVRLP